MVRFATLLRPGAGVVALVLAATSFLTGPAAAAATVAPAAEENNCTARIDTLYNYPENTFQYRVVASCTSLAPDMEVRGVLPFALERDLHTPWITDTGKEYASEYHLGALPLPQDVPRLEYRSLAVGPAPAGTECELTSVPDPRYNDGFRRKAGIRCSAVPPGVQVRLDINYASSVWVSEANTDEWHWTGDDDWTSYRVVFRADPSGAGSSCHSELVTTYERSFGYDDHAVRAWCDQIADAVKVRGKADYSLQDDTYTDWITTPGTTHQSPGQARWVWTMPTAGLEYELRESGSWATW